MVKKKEDISFGINVVNQLSSEIDLLKATLENSEKQNEELKDIISKFVIERDAFRSLIKELIK